MRRPSTRSTSSTRGSFGITQAIAVPAGVGAAILFFSNLAQYSFSSGLVPVAPTVLVLGLALAAAFQTTLALRERQALDWPLLVWCAVYLSVSLVGAVIAPQTDEAVAILHRRFLSVLFLLATRMIFSDETAAKWALRAVVGAEIWGVGLNVYEYFFPLTFSFSYGRAAGLYMNPNISGGALVAGMLLGLRVIRPLWREWFILFCGAGVVLTFSRGAVIAWSVACALLLCTKEMRRLKLLIVAAVCAVSFWGAVYGSAWFGAASADLLANRPELMRRIGVSGSQSDSNSDSRMELATVGFNRFLRSPFVGNGLGATTTDWQYSEGTHVIYATLLAEHGLLGGALFPALLWLIYARGRQQGRGAITFAVFLAVWGVFSHNVVDEFHLLFATGAMLAAADSAKSAQVRGRAGKLVAGLQSRWTAVSTRLA